MNLAGVKSCNNVGKDSRLKTQFSEDFKVLLMWIQALINDHLKLPTYRLYGSGCLCMVVYECCSISHAISYINSSVKLGTYRMHLKFNCVWNCLNLMKCIMHTSHEHQVSIKSSKLQQPLVKYLPASLLCVQLRV